MAYFADTSDVAADGPSALTGSSPALASFALDSITGVTGMSLGLASEVAGWGKLQLGLGSLYAEWRGALAASNGAAITSVYEGFTSTNTIARISNGYVAIDAVAANGNGAALLVQLQALGLQSGASFGNMAGGLIPLDAIDDLAGLTGLSFARPVYAITDVGTVTSQDDAALRTDDVRTSFGVDGTGIRIGILSDSFATRTGPITTYAQDVASGDLPTVNIVKDMPTAGSDEGRAMAQLIHDIAPGASLSYYTAFVSLADFATGIVTLAGISDIVVDDIRYFTEPFFQDGILAQAVNQAVDMGAMYFASAGNYAANSYESAYRASGETITITGGSAPGLYQLHDFDPGAGVDTRQRVTLTSGSNLILQWDQPFKSGAPASAGSQSDMAIVVRNTVGTILATINDFNIGGDPVEIVGTFNGTYDISLLLRDGSPAPGILKYVIIGGSLTASEFAAPSGTSFGHSSAVGALSVAAVPWYRTPDFGVTPPVPETFTSKGGVPILFDTDGTRLATPIIRDKVDFASSDGGNTTFFASDSNQDADTFPNFFGTSAAAPNAAALAALLMQKFPTATNAQIVAALKASAIDIVSGYANSGIGVGYDYATGVGLIQGPAAVAALQAILAADAGTANTIAIVGYNTGQSDASGNPATTDSLTFVALTALTEGTVIYFTDRAWTGTAFTTGAGDGTYAYTVGAGGVAAGATVTIGQVALAAAGVDLAEAGDTIYAYIGTNADTPNEFLNAVEIGDGNQVFDGSLANTGLVAGTSAVAVGYDSAAYAGPTTTAGAQIVNGTTLAGSVADATNWVGGDRTTVNALQPPVQTGPWLVAPDVELIGAASGGGGGIVRAATDATVSGGTAAFDQTIVFNGLVSGGNPVLFAPRDIVLDTVDGKFFLIDSDVTGGHNRILQGNIADLNANPGSVPTLTVLYSDPGTTAASRIGGIEVDVANNIVYFTHGSQLVKLAYTTAAQAGTVLFDADTVANPTGNGPSTKSLSDIAINFATGDIYIASSAVTTGANGDVVDANYIYRLVGLTTGSGAGAFSFDGSNTGSARLLPVSPTDAGYDPTAGTTVHVGPAGAAAFAFPAEYGAITGLAVDPVSGRLYFSTQEVNFDTDASGATAAVYAGGVIGSYALTGNAAGAYTILYQQTAATGGAVPGVFGDIEYDAVANRYYVADTVGKTIYSGSGTVAAAPTVFAAGLTNVGGLTVNGIALNHAPTLSVTGNATTITEIAGVGSGETAAAFAFTAVTIADADTTNGSDEIVGATIRITGGYQGGANQDVLKIDGNISGMIAALGITYSFTAATGVMTLSGAATVAEYQTAIQSVTFSISGDNPTAFGTALTRTVAIAVTDGLSVSDERTTTLTIAAENDAPVNTLPVGTQNGVEDRAVTIAGLSVADPDANPATQKITVRLAVDVGTVTVANAVVGGLSAADITGNGTGNVLLTGTQNELNATFASGTGVRYFSVADGSGPATLTMTTSDTGLNGSGGTKQDVDTLSIVTVAVNDAPISSGLQGDAVNFTENGPAVKIDLNGNAAFADVDSSNFAGGTLTIAITAGKVAAQDELRIDTTGLVSVVAGAVSVNGTSIGTVTGGGAGGNDLVFTLNSGATPNLISFLVRAIDYFNTGNDAPTVGLRTITTTLVDGDGTANGGVDTLALTSGVTVISVNDTPTGTDQARTIDEDNFYVLRTTDFGFADADGNPFYGVRFASLPTNGVLSIDGSSVVAGTLYQAGAFDLGRVRFTPAVNANGAAYATFTFQVDDGTFGGNSLDLSPNSFTFNVTAVEDAPVAVADFATTTENSTVVIAVLANDSDAEGDPLTIISIDGQVVASGGVVALASGARVTLRADGTLVYDPNGAFAALNAGSLDTNSFTYALNGGGVGTVTVRIDGSSPGDPLLGTPGDNIVTGTAGTDDIDVSQGGVDIVNGGGGDDGIYFGAAFGPGDVANGGAGANDQIGLQGDYSAGVTLGSAQVTGVEVVAAMPGFSYSITTLDNLIAAGGTITFYAGMTSAGQSFTLNASAETNGSMLVYGGLGTDVITTGAGNDGIYFGPGRYDPATDIVDGGVGTNDQLALDGNYTLTLSGAVIRNIEVISLIAGPVGAPSTYSLTLADDLTAAGGTKTIYAVPVLTALLIDGSLESNGNLVILGGTASDVLKGGAGADWLYGNTGNDTLTGNAGADRFHLATVPAANNIDTITDFSVAQGDKIELDDFAFTTLTPGALAASAFVVGTAATTANHRIIYDAATGALFYDADGNGAGAEVQFATLTGNPTLTAAEFVIV